MADDRRRQQRPGSSRPDPRGSPAAMVSALVVAGLIFTAAVLLHFGELPEFLTPPVSLGQSATIEGAIEGELQSATDDAPSARPVSLEVSVPKPATVAAAAGQKAKQSDQENQDQSVVTVAVRVHNASDAKVTLTAGQQKLRTDLSRSYPSTTATALAVPPGSTRTLKLRFRIPESEQPRTLLLSVAGQQKKFDVS